MANYQIFSESFNFAKRFQSGKIGTKTSDYNAHCRGGSECKFREMDCGFDVSIDQLITPTKN